MWTLYTLKEGKNPNEKHFIRCGQGNPVCLDYSEARLRIEQFNNQKPLGVTMHRMRFKDVI